MCNKHKWTEIHKELTKIMARSLWCGFGEIEVWLILEVKYTKKGTWKGRVFARSISGDKLQDYPIDYILVKHPDSQLVSKLKKYKIS